MKRQLIIACMCAGLALASCGGSNSKDASGGGAGADGESITIDTPMPDTVGVDSIIDPATGRGQGGQQIPENK
ncbi:hypothetical protein [Mucilaginibacter hurinus]|nr:hypothetical protein [Mucilaginibacter hurinus]